MASPFRQTVSRQPKVRDRLRPFRHSPKSKGKSLLTLKLATHDAPDGHGSSDRMSSARPTLDQSSWHPSKTMTIKPRHSMVTSFSNSIPKNHLRDVDLNRANSSGFFHALISSFTRVFASDFHLSYFYAQTLTLLFCVSRLFISLVMRL